LRRAFGDEVRVILDFPGDLVEQLVQADEIRAFDVPVRLLELSLEVERIREALVQEIDQLGARDPGQVIFGFVERFGFRHFGSASVFHFRVLPIVPSVIFVRIGQNIFLIAQVLLENERTGLRPALARAPSAEQNGPLDVRQRTDTTSGAPPHCNPASAFWQTEGQVSKPS
jgi:hypothetical protein